MTTTRPPGPALSSQRRMIAVVVLGASVAAGATAITILSLIMRSVTGIGGSCADGGSDAQSCSSGSGTALLLVLACAVACLIGTVWAASVVRAPVPLLAGWSALFLTLGWNLLEAGFDSPTGEGVAVGVVVVCGVLCLLVGAGPWLLRLPARRRSRRTRRAQSGAGVAAAPPRSPARRHPPRAAEPTPAPRAGPRDGDRGVRALSVAGRLERLAALHASGALTHDEYARAKRATGDEEL